MPTFVYMTACDGCGHCVDICPSDIMHIDPTTRRAVNIEPNFCWDCYLCVKACPQNAIDSPIRTTEWGSIKCASEYEEPTAASVDSPELAHEPDYLKADGGLRTISKKQFKKHPIAKAKASSLKAAE